MNSYHRVRSRLFAVLLLSAACGDEDGGGDGGETADAGRSNRRDGGAQTDDPGDETDDPGDETDEPGDDPDDGGAQEPVETTQDTITRAGGTITLNGASGDVITSIEVPANAVNEDTPITLGAASLGSAAPATVVEAAPGFSVDLGGATLNLPAKARVRVTFSPSDSDLRVVAYVPSGVITIPIEVVQESGQSYGVFDVKEGGEYTIIRIPFAAGCDKTLDTAVYATSNADLEQLRGVRRVTSSINISGANVNSLEALSCLVEVNNGMVITGTELESLEGLSNLTLLADNRLYYFNNLSVSRNARLKSVELPSLLVAQSSYAQGVEITGNAVLERISLPALNGGALAISANASASTALAIEASNLRYAPRLEVRENAALAALDGLGALRTVTGQLTVFSNDSLKHIDGLGSLTTVTGDLSIDDNINLEQLDGLANLERAASLSISMNNLLVRARLNKLTALTGQNANTASSLSVVNNTALASFEAKLLTRVGQLRFQGNGNASTALAVAFDVLSEASASTDISQNLGLRDLAGWAALSKAESISVRSNGSLTSLTGFDRLADANDITISQNARLETAELPGLTRLRGSLDVNNNAVLTRVALPRLATLGGSLSFGTNARLSGVSADVLALIPQNLTLTSNGAPGSPLLLTFPALSSVSSDVNISTNAGLTTFSGLAALRSVGRNLSFGGNTNLTTIGGLATLTTVTGALSISNHALLTSLPGLAALERVSAGISFSNNAALGEISLPALRTAGGALTVSNNTALTALRADGLPTVASLSFASNGRNAAATALSMAALSTVTGQFSVSGNARLTQLNGFGTLARVGSYSVSSNTTLSTCQVVALRNQIQANGTIGSVYVNGNLADGCTP